MNDYALTMIFVGIFLLVFATLTRYVLRLGLISSKCRKLLASVSPVDLRQKNIDAIIFLFQITTLLLIIFAAGYDILTNNLIFKKWVDDILSFIVVVGPSLFFGGLGRWLQRKYWSKSDGSS